MVHSMPGQRLPAERALCDKFNVSRANIRAALQELESQGLVHRRQGSGTYAVDRDNGALRKIVILVDSEIKLEADPFFSSLIDKLQRAIQEDGIECLLQRVENSNLPTVTSDAVIILGQVANTLLASWQNIDLPAVALFADSPTPHGSRVSVMKWDDRTAGYCTGSRILDAGLQKACFVGRRYITASRQRFEGLQQALEASNVKLEFCECRLHYAAGIEVAGKLAKSVQGERSAVVAYNDWLALGIHVGLLQKDARLRKKVSLFSFDGLEICADPSMGIESLAIPVDEIIKDTLMELHRLAASPVTRGRVIQYAP